MLNARDQDSGIALEIQFENQALRKDFEMRGLDPMQVLPPTFHTAAEENQALKKLLDWVVMYKKFGSRKQMEANGYNYPPVDPPFGPDNDWALFLKWLNGERVLMKLKERLPLGYVIKRVEELTDEEVNIALDTITGHLAKFNIAFEFMGGIPIRIKYMEVLVTLEEQVHVADFGNVIIDGCSGYCPGCVQRSWCEMGAGLWQEDTEAQKMVLPDAVKAYVSAAPNSLKLLNS